MLTRRLQKIAAATVCVVVVLVCAVHFNLDLLDKQVFSGELRDSLNFYHGKVKNYTSSFYDEIEDGLQALKTTITTPSSIRELMQPAFQQEQHSDPAKVVKNNKKFMANLMRKKIDEPKGFKLSRPEDTRANATFMSLVRNAELEGISETIKQIEQTFNHKFHYPYVFLNDQPFTDEFKQGIKTVTESECFFEEVSPELWDKPSHIDPDKEEEGLKFLEDSGVGYARKLSYHNMCRFYSRSFYKHPRMSEFKYYWRLEPNTNYFCDIDYDVFRFMEQNDKVYGYVLNLYDSPESVRSLWPTTMEFLLEHPQYLNENAASVWLRENLQNPRNFEVAHGYSTCHFWSNFEIGDMDFYRANAYSKWVEFLEQSGGFYYERWGDAPVHSVGVALFADKHKVHWFRDIGYEHFPYFNCPVSDRCHGKCKEGMFSKFDNLNDQNCQATWVQNEMTEEELEYY